MKNGLRGLQRYLVLCLFLCIGTLTSYSQAAKFLYTANNLSSGNGVHAFSVADDGSLTELAGSPYATGGEGDDISPFTQNGVIIDPSKRFLLVVNHGSSDISVFRILRNGSLRMITGSPYKTGGTFPVSISMTGNIAYVSHLGTGGGGLAGPCEACDVRGFRLVNYGRLRPIPGAVYPMEETPSAFPLAIQFNPAGDVLFGTRFVFSEFFTDTIGELFSFQLDRESGLLTKSPGSPYAVRRGSNQPIGFAFSPINPSQLFVANSVSDTPQLEGSMSTYLMAESGQIAELDFSPVPASLGNDRSVATCWAVLTSNGENLYATSTTTDNMTRYKVAENGQLDLQEVINIPPIDAVNDSPVDMLITPDDQYLYVVQTLVGSIAGWRINEDGSLSLLDNQPVPLPAGTTPYGLVMVER